MTRLLLQKLNAFKRDVSRNEQVDPGGHSLVNTNVRPNIEHVPPYYL